MDFLTSCRVLYKDSKNAVGNTINQDKKMWVHSWYSYLIFGMCGGIISVFIFSLLKIIAVIFELLGLEENWALFFATWVTISFVKTGHDKMKKGIDNIINYA